MLRLKLPKFCENTLTNFKLKLLYDKVKIGYLKEAHLYEKRNLRSPSGVCEC